MQINIHSRIQSYWDRDFLLCSFITLNSFTGILKKILDFKEIYVVELAVTNQSHG